MAIGGLKYVICSFVMYIYSLRRLRYRSKIMIVKIHICINAVKVASNSVATALTCSHLHNPSTMPPTTSNAYASDQST